jgi:hypothetical protein
MTAGDFLNQSGAPEYIATAMFFRMSSRTLSCGYKARSVCCLPALRHDNPVALPVFHPAGQAVLNAHRRKSGAPFRPADRNLPIAGTATGADSQWDDQLSAEQLLDTKEMADMPCL